MGRLKKENGWESRRRMYGNVEGEWMGRFKKEMNGKVEGEWMGRLKKENG